MDVKRSKSCPGRFSPGKNPRYKLNRKLTGLQSRSGRFWKRENVFSLDGIWSPDRAGCIYMLDWDIPAPWICLDLFPTWRDNFCRPVQCHFPEKKSGRKSTPPSCAVYRICAAQLSMSALTTESCDVSHLDVLIDNAERDPTDVQCNPLDVACLNHWP